MAFTGESEITDEFGEGVMIDYRLGLPLARQILDDHVGALHRAHAKDGPEESLQGGLEVHEGALLLDLHLRLLVDLHHPVVVLIQIAQPWGKFRG